MLKEIFRTVPIPYLHQDDGTGQPVWYPPENYPPWIESMSSISGIHVMPESNIPVPKDPGHYALPTSPASLYVWCTFHSGYWPSWRFGYFRFNAVTGQMVERASPTVAGGTFSTLGSMIRSRKGVVWMLNFWGTEYQKASIGETLSALVDDEPEDEEGWFQLLGETIPISHFGPYNGVDSMGMFSNGAIDDVADVYIDAGLYGFNVFKLSTGVLRYHLELPFPATAVALEDDSRIYVLGGNILLLYDYVRGDVLGATRLQVHTGYGVTMTWDPIFRRLLLATVTENAADGSSTNVIRGYRQVPEGVRLTTPIPLKSPRRGRTIPVLTQVVGDMNEGVGGYVINAVVEGGGTLVGFPITNHYAETKMQITCDSTEDVDVTVSARIYAPDPVDVPISGVSGEEGGEPGAPGGGGGPQRFLWDFYDRGGNPIDSPHSGAPNSFAEWQTYFFTITNRAIDTPANDFEAVLQGLVDQGMRTNAEPGEVPQSSWPFYGMQMIIDASNFPRGRIQLPTATPDSLGYYTHEVQVIKDDPNVPANTETAPNMSYVVTNVYNSQTWRLTEAYEDEIDGRGKFTEKCAIAMHDVDARFGHIKKNPGQNQYNGHAVDAIVFKNDDEITAEIFTIVTGAGERVWTFVDRSTDNLTKWYYPA